MKVSRTISMDITLLQRLLDLYPDISISEAIENIVRKSLNEEKQKTGSSYSKPQKITPEQ